MNVLSLFDGFSGTRQALEDLGVTPENYFASEVDKYTIQAAQSLYPDTIQVGSVEFVTKQMFVNHGIDLLVAGSPCQGFSNAGAGLNFSDPRSALFFEFLRIKKELKPKYWLLENVKMKKEWRDTISELVGCEPILINSRLLSAQNRTRYYWTNIPGIEQPDDLGLVLRDVIDYSVDGELSEKEMGYMTAENTKWQGAKGGRLKNYGKKESDKGMCVTANQGKGVPYGVVGIQQVGDKLRMQEATKKGYAEAGEGEGLDASVPKSKTRRGRAMPIKSNCVTGSHNMGIVIDPSKPNQINPDRSAKSSSAAKKGTQPHMQDRVFHIDGKSHALTSSFADRTKTGEIKEGTLLWRKLTPKECARLQTVSEPNIERLLSSGVSNSQLYKMIGNGFTVKVISHILRNVVISQTNEKTQIK